MSWLYLPAQVAGCSPAGCSDGEQFVTSKITSIVLRYSRRAYGTDSLTMPPSGTTCAISTGIPGLDAWISSLRDFRANRSLLEENTSKMKIYAIAGLIPFALLMKSNQNSFSWKTVQDSFWFTRDEYPISNILLQSWPNAGMWDAGAVYRLPLLEPITNGNGCGLLPTPVARDGKSFYVVTEQTALRIINKWPRKQSHWIHYGIVFHGLKKAWANPTFSEHLMEYPIGWTDLKPLEMDRYQEWLLRHGNF